MADGVIFFNGIATLSKTNPPKNVIEWDKNTKQDIGTTVHIQSEVTVSGVTYTTTTDVVIECKDVWALAGQWDGQALRLYACATPNSTGSSIITTTTTIKGYPEGDRVTTNTTEGTIGATASMLGTYAVPSGETGSVSGANFIPLFAGYNEPINYLNTGEGLTDDTNTNGLDNGSPVIPGQQRIVRFDYNQCSITMSSGVGITSDIPWRKGVYGVKVEDNNGNYIYLPSKYGMSWNHAGTNYRADRLDGTFRMSDTNGENAFFPNVEYSRYAGVAIGSEYYNDSFYCYVENNGTYETSFCPASELPTTEWDVIDTTYGVDCPVFDSEEALIQYLLGEIDESYSVNDNPPDNEVNTENNTPSQNMVAGEGVNFIY